VTITVLSESLIRTLLANVTRLRLRPSDSQGTRNISVRHRFFRADGRSARRQTHGRRTSSRNPPWRTMSVAVGQIGRPEEIADAVLWLCSDRSSFVTGTAMPVDGGYVAR
jgi:NAD(P)-dependent dehydrogenase (short-subunit alcohol dehydrogenase family)